MPAYMHPIDLVLHGDTTGSMAPCRSEVLKKFEVGFTRLFKEIPHLRVALGFNGDYCDKGRRYVTRWHNFSRDLYALTQFIRTTGPTDGGDLAECYERVLYEGLSLSWDKNPNTKKIFVLAADDVPHPVNDPHNRIYNGGKGLDWREQAAQYAKRGIMICAVQCLSKSYATSFYRELAGTYGYHLILDQFSDLMDLIIAVCYQQLSRESLMGWEQELSDRGQMTRSFDTNFTTLTRGARSRSFAEHDAKLRAVPPGRFQMLQVEKEEDGMRIDGFVRAHDLEFKPGRGFYEFTKPELIQEKKEVVLRHKITGDMFTGNEARRLIGLKPGERARVRPTDLMTYHVFVQSTSYTRKLVGGTRFLYEVDLDR